MLGNDLTSQFSRPSNIDVSVRPFAGLPKIIVVALCEDKLYRTDGTTTYIADIIDVAQIRALGPMIAQMRVHYVCESATTNFRAKVTSSWSVIGRTWSTPVDLNTAVVGDHTGSIGSWYVTDSAFGLLMRYAIAVSNNSGDAIESGRLSVFLEIELKS